MINVIIFPQETLGPIQNWDEQHQSHQSLLYRLILKFLDL